MRAPSGNIGFCFAALLVGIAGCTPPVPRPDYVEITRYLRATVPHIPAAAHPDEPTRLSLETPTVVPELEGPHPVDVYVSRALAASRAIAAARNNLDAMRARIPQALALENPLLQNTLMPFADNSTQTAAGRMANSVTLTQRFPWFGTLPLRGEVAKQEAHIAQLELAAMQLDVTTRVKLAYHDLYFKQRAREILDQNRDLAEEFVEIARVRYESGSTTQQDVLSAEVVVDEVENELVQIREQLIAARATLARLLHVSPQTELRALAELPIADVPQEAEQLRRLAAVARPELGARLVALLRDQKQVQLARKRYYPDFNLGLLYQTVSEDNALAPSANGRDNFGLMFGIDIPIYFDKLAAGVREAESKAIADAERYLDLRDQTDEKITQLMAEATAQRDVIARFRESIIPKSKQALDVAISDYAASTREFVTLISVWQEVLRVELQTVRLESELGKTLAELEQVVGGPSGAPLP
jgi:outer membrane protein TolC